MSARYDVIIIGAGHNGLVAAAYLARAGLKVLALERRPVLGGAAATEEVFPDCRVDAGAADAGQFRPDIVEDLGLENLGLDFIEPPAIVHGLRADGEGLTIWRDAQRTADELTRFSTHDARQYPRFVTWLGQVGRVLEQTLLLAPPRPSAAPGAQQLWPWLRPALGLRRLGRRSMMEVLQTLPMSARELLDRWFESDLLKGAAAASAVQGGRFGPWASGTAYGLLYHALGAEGAPRACRLIRGGIGQLSLALAAAARAAGAEIKLDSPVAQILINEGRAGGVRLEDGQEHRATAVVSNADPVVTLFRLVGARYLPLKVVRRVRSLRFQGATARLLLLLDRLPAFNGRFEPERLSGHIVVAPDLAYIERAADDAKYGRFSRRPVLDLVIPTLVDPSLAPAGRHLMLVSMQYAPYHLREGSWDAYREPLRDLVISVLAEYSPDLPAAVSGEQTLTPLDLERRYGLTEGSPYHGEMALDQLLFMRPIPGYARYQMPLPGLYLCGAGAHPGGGVTGAPGHNAARAVLEGLGG